jgi:hypothetical protein
MRCQCGSKEEVWVHGHSQCLQCGRLNDGDCCQGESPSIKRNKAYEENRIRNKAKKPDGYYDATDY